MDLSPYLNSLREDLNAAASAGDENTKRAAAVLSAALEPAARLAIMSALSDLADEVTAQLDNTVVDVRLSGRDVRVVVDTRESRERGEPRETPPPPPPSGGGDITRMTLRLFEELKNKAEQAAAEQGVSLNTFVQQALQGALQGKHPGSWSSEWQGGRPGDRGNDGNEIHGWVQS